MDFTYQNFLEFMARYEQDAYQSSYTGPQIDEGVGTARTAGAASGILKSNGAGVISAAVAGEDYASPASVSSIYSTITASGSVVTFNAESAGLPIKDMTVSIVPVQSGSGTPTPTNIRLIPGFDVAHVYVGPTQVVADATAYAVQLKAVAGTVYRGTIYPIKGELIVDMAEIDLGDITWTTQTIGSVSGFVGDFGTDNIRGDNAADNSYLCTCYRFINDTRTVLESANYAFTPQNKSNSYKLALRDDRYSTAAALKAGITGQKLVYQLKNPVVYQLSPVEIETLLGQNTIWADTGDVSVTYGAYLAAVNDHADRVNASLLNLMTCTAPIENGATASQAYAQGAYFFHNGDFCKAKTAISSGATFTLGTNYQITTVSAAIVALQS